MSLPRRPAEESRRPGDGTRRRDPGLERERDLRSSSASSTARTRPGSSKTVPLSRDEHDVWSATTGAPLPRHLLRHARRRVRTAPMHAFEPHRNLLDPYARGLARTPDGEWRGYVQDGWFDWGGVQKPRDPARPHRRLRGARAGAHEAQPRHPGGAARHLRRPRPPVDHRVPRRTSASRPSSCCRCTSTSTSSGCSRWASSTTGATTPSTSSPRTPRTPAAPPSSAAPARCCASSRGWCGCCTRPASR